METRKKKGFHDNRILWTNSSCVHGITMETSDGFIPIVAIFYSVFHPIEGTKIVHQFPENSISTGRSPTSIGDGGLFDFDTIKNYVIPKPQLCNRLISLKIDKYKVIGYPVNMESSHYARNSFNFNFCFVFRYDMGDVSPYESAIKRMGQMFQVLEEQSFMLSSLDKDNSFFKDKAIKSNKALISSSLSSDGTTREPLDEGGNENHFHPHNVQNGTSINTPGFAKTKKIALSSIESLIQQIYQDLNNYSECCIPLDTSNSVDIKLFPILPPPINIKAYQVPIVTVRLNSLVDVNWDPTMIKILPYINGLNSVKKISELADANYLLTKQCIQHLMHYKCIEVIDIFQFGNIYAPTNHIGEFLKHDGKMAEECQAYVVSADFSMDNTSYVNTPTQMHLPYPGSDAHSPTYNYRSSYGTSSVSPYTKYSFLSRSPKNPMVNGSDVKVPTKTTLFYLYRSLNQGQTVKEWYMQHKKILGNVDIRRFINFGVLRGIIYRVYTYPLLNSFTGAIERNDTEQYDELLSNLKKKKPKRIVSIGRNENLLKTKVNEQTLRTDVKRKVSFAYSQSDKHDLRRFSTNDVILENDSSDYDDDDDDDDDDSSDEGFNGNGHIIHNRTPISERTARVSSSSYYSDIEEDAVNEEEYKIKANLLKMLKGFQSFDSICTELNKSRTEVEQLIESFGAVNIVNS